MSRTAKPRRTIIRCCALAASCMIGLQGVPFTNGLPSANAFPGSKKVDDGWVKDFDVPRPQQPVPEITEGVESSEETKPRKQSIAQRLPMGLKATPAPPLVPAGANPAQWATSPGSATSIAPTPGVTTPPKSAGLSVSTGDEGASFSGESTTSAPKSAIVATPTTASGQPTPLLKGQVTYCVPSGTPIKLKLATIPMPQMKMDMRDEEGNLRPAQLGEIITAKTTEDIYVDDNKVIPEGTVFHGKVAKISAPRHVGRPGHLELSFDRFTTPDGKTFAFKAQANNFRESTNKSKLKGAGRIAAHAAGGAALGALVAYKLFGPEQTVAMHGYNIAGGAAIGAVGGIAWALWKRGPQAVLEPGDEFAMSIDMDMLIPAATAPTVKAPPPAIKGFEMEVLSKKVVKDGFGGHMMRVETWITNRSKKKLTSIDFFVQDDLGNRYPITPDVEDDELQDIFHIHPMTVQKIKCSFQIEYPKLKHKLIWLDHYTHRVIMEQKL